MRFRGINPLLVLIASVVASIAARSSSTHGPARGTLILQGDVGDNRAIAAAFVTAAGGPSSHVIVIPTASVFDAGPPGMATFLAGRMKESLGVGEVTVLHALDRATSDSDSFVEPLRKATGVWILGGMPERLVQAYLNTETERAIKELLDRGGVVGGESAGAMIQGSWLDTTDGESFTPDILALIRAHGTGGGFGLLTHSAIFPHFDKRGPEAAMHESAAHPNQLAIGIDEGTALVVRGDRAEVVGVGTVTMFDGAGRGGSNVVILKSGERYDLAARRRQ
jgi:cyanophycinase